MKVRITAEQMAFAGATLLAAILRAWNLGSTPLQPAEAAVSVQAWSMFRGLPSTIDLGPLLTYGNALVFSLVGASDASTRLLPLLAGCILVGLCGLTRPYIGRHAAISGAFLLAISPTAVFFSRFAGSELIATTALFGSAVLLFRHLQSPVSFAKGAGTTSFPRSRLYLFGSAVAAGLAISASASAWVGMGILLSLVGAVWLLRRFGWRGQLPILYARDQATDGGIPTLAPDLDIQAIRNAALALGATVVLATTGMFSNLHGIQEGLIRPLLLQSPPVAGASGYSPAYYVQILVIYETVTVVFAFVRVLYSTRPKGLFTWYLIWWALASLFLYSVLPQKSALLVIQPLVPTALLAGEIIGDLLSWLEKERPFARLGVLSVITSIPLLLTIYVITRSSLPGEKLLWEFAIASLVVLGLAVGGFALWHGLGQTVRVGGVYLLALLLAINVHVGSNLNFRGQLDATELLAPSATVADVRNLASDVADLARFARASEGKGVFVDSSLRYPLAWYLRQVDGAEYGLKPAGTPTITVARGTPLASPGPRTTQRYVVSSTWESRRLMWGAFWRWLAYREPGGPLRYEVAEVSLRR